MRTCGGAMLNWGRGLCAAAVTSVVALLPVTSSANEVLESRLAALLGEESRAIAAIPDRRLAVLTSVPAPSDRNISTAPQAFDYTNSFLASLPNASGDAQWRCLSEALYFEARGESTRGIFAVGEVILNRVDSAAYPNSICGVINQGTGRKFQCQFTYTCDGRAETIGEPLAFQKVAKVARLLIDGAARELTDGATHYHTKAVNPSWARRFPRTATIGFHYFYRQPTRQASN